jgi:hypothetical protein
MNDDRPVSPPPVWSAQARSWVSLLLFMHLFAVGVAVTTYTRPSGLQENLHRLFDPYLRTLHMTAFPVSYPFARYHLTHAMPSDVDFICEVDVAAADGTPEKVTIPPAGLKPLIRYRRYQALANAVGTLAQPEGDEEFSGILPKAIAGAILKQRGATQGVIRVRAHYLPELSALGQSEQARRRALENYADIYEAQVLVSDGSVELLKKSNKLESAPVESRPSASGSGKVVPKQ